MERPADYTTLISGNKAALSHSHVTKTWEFEKIEYLCPMHVYQLQLAF